VILVAPTGSGKTTIAAAIIHAAAAKGKRVLFLAHRKELIDQAITRLAEHDIAAGIIMAGRQPFPHRAVQVASVQTLARREVPPSDLVIVDECHHARAKSYQRAIGAAPVTLGLTATPWRTDGRGLGELFEGVVVAARPAELITDGYLCPVTGFAYDAPDLSGVKTAAGDYEEGGAAAVMAYVGGNVVQRWIDFRPGRSVLFACTIEHSRQMVERFRDAGVIAEHLDGTTPIAERAAILSRLASGATEVVCNVGVLTEGWDLPSLRCVILARPTKSLGLYIQMAGRGLRPADGKACARIHDHAGNALRHGPVDLDRNYSLDKDTSRGEKAPATKTCPKCFAIFSPGPKECPACGADLRPEPGTARAINEVEGVEVSLDEVRRRYVPGGEALPVYRQLVAEAAARGWKPGWASVEFQRRYGFWPRKEWRAAEVAPVDDVARVLAAARRAGEAA
jgi:superfamily II DNA or RNA helicase